MVVGQANVCNDTCEFPFGLVETAVFSQSAYYCVQCDVYIRRSDQTCVSQCGYLNITQINSTSVTVCEDPSD